jgi:hypothetical protein
MTNFMRAKVCYYEQKGKRSTPPSVIPAEAGIHFSVFQQPGNAIPERFVFTEMAAKRPLSRSNAKHWNDEKIKN